MSSDAGIEGVDEDVFSSEAESDEGSEESLDEDEQLNQLAARLKNNLLFLIPDPLWTIFLVVVVCFILPLLLAILESDFVSGGPLNFTKDPSKPAHAEYCNSFLNGTIMPILSLEASEGIQCRLCPDNARCRDGHISRCHEGYTMTHALCVDSNDVNLVLALRMLVDVIQSLRMKAGAVQCAHPSSGPFERGVTEEDFPDFVEAVAFKMGIEDYDLYELVLPYTLWNILTPNPDDYGLLTGKWIVPDVLDATSHDYIVAPPKNALRSFPCRILRWFAYVYTNPLRFFLLVLVFCFIHFLISWKLDRAKIEMVFFEIRATPNLRSHLVAGKMESLLGVRLPVEGMSPAGEPVQRD